MLHCIAIRPKSMFLCWHRSGCMQLVHDTYLSRKQRFNPQKQKGLPRKLAETFLPKALAEGTLRIALATRKVSQKQVVFPEINKHKSTVAKTVHIHKVINKVMHIQDQGWFPQGNITAADWKFGTPNHGLLRVVSTTKPSCGFTTLLKVRSALQRSEV